MPVTRRRSRRGVFQGNCRRACTSGFRGDSLNSAPRIAAVIVTVYKRLPGEADETNVMMR